ncbi:MAG: HAMP domain-containing histidine kinase [Bacteroidales bacterium]|nr:HAMP domain-containing histidine kinase [Bacteroidales bacterium]
MKRSLLAILITVFALAAMSLVLIQINQMRQTFLLSDNMFNTAVGNAMDQVMENIADDDIYTQQPTFSSLDSLIADELLEAGIDLKPEMGIYDASLDEFYYCSQPGMENRLRTSPFKYSYHPSGIISSNQYFIILAFPKTALFLRQNSHLYFYMSIFLIVVVVLLFAISMVVAVNQHKVDEMKTAFVNNMTHEIKTPIATIGLACEMLKEGDTGHDPTASQALNIISDENRRMRILVETILQSSKMADPRFPLDRKEVDINATVRAVLQSFRLAIDNTGGTLITELKADPPTLFADELHITNMIYNLVDNAIKYSGQNICVTVATATEGKNIVVSVSDRGIGIARREQRRIFDKFYRVSTGDVHNVKGFGIGLNYVAQVVKLHHGHIGLQSQPGEGSTFTVKLPRY